jgi:zinc protease
VKTLVILLAFAASASAAPFDKSGIADWTKPPAAAPEPTFVPPTAKRMKLANGMALLVIENHKLPIVSMHLLVPGAGTAYDPKAKPGVAAFTADMLDEGAAGLNAIQISEEQDRLGAGIGVFAGVDSAGVSVGTLTKTLPETIDLLTKLLVQPTFDAKDFERVKGDRGTSLELRRDRPREVVAIVLGAALYGLDSAYGHPGAGQRESFKSISIDDLQAFYKAHWNPATMTLVVAGDVDAALLQKKLDAGLGAWKQAAPAPARPDTTPVKTLKSRLVVVDRKDAAQSDVRIGLVGPERSDKRFFAFEVMQNALGGGFTSRLVQRLREQLGITYGIGARMDWRQAPGPFAISSAIVTPETAKGLREIIKIVDDLATTDVPAAELDKSKLNIIRALPASFDTNAATARTFADLVEHGLPDDYYAHYADGIRAVTAADVKVIAKALIPSNRMVFAIVGDMAKIGPELKKLELGPMETRDLYGMPIATTNK